MGSLTQVFTHPKFKDLLQTILATPAVLVKQLSLTCDSSKLNQSNQTRSLAESKRELFILSALFISFIDWCLFSSQGWHAPVATIGQLQLGSCSGQFLLCFACMNRSCQNEPINYGNCLRCLVESDWLFWNVMKLNHCVHISKWFDDCSHARLCE